jgi:hypothetical protein
MAGDGRATLPSPTQLCALTRRSRSRTSPQIALRGSPLVARHAGIRSRTARTHHKLTTRPSRGVRCKRETACSSHGASRTRTGDLLGAIGARRGLRGSEGMVKPFPSVPSAGASRPLLLLYSPQTHHADSRCCLLQQRNLRRVPRGSDLIDVVSAPNRLSRREPATPRRQ